jgi:tetratricopeptide (TPR) repeat protein
MMKALFMLFMLVGTQVLACVNEYRTLLSGEVIFTDALSGIPYYKSFDVPGLQRELFKLDSLYKIDKSHETLSDYGVILIYLGRYDDAINVYRRIEREHPGLYATAANIGTAFELAGEIDSASYYIRQAITIDPDSHEGSEWIHLKILEAKQKMISDPNYLDHASILGLDFGTAEKPVDPKTQNIHDVQTQLAFQLGERLSFVKPPDKIVGQLLFDLGNMHAITTDVQTALECYEFAETYGYESYVMDKRIGAMRPLALKATIANEGEEKVKKNPLWALVLVAFAGIGLILLIRFVRRRRKQ